MKALEPLKAARANPVLNAVVALPLRRALRSTGRESRWLTRHLPRSGVVRTRLPDGNEVRMWSRGDDWISTQLFWRGLAGYEPGTASVLYGLAARGSMTIDVGAYVGYMTLLAAVANRDGRVLAIEPLPRTFQRLVRNVRLNGVGNVECVNVAAGSRPGQAMLHHAPSGLNSAASLNPRHLTDVPEHALTPVPVVRLADLLEERRIERVDLIKLDTETTEAEALQGARGVLSRDRPHIICEVLDRPGVAVALTDIVGPLGYRFYELDDAGPRERAEIVPVADDDGGPGNYLFTTLEPAEVTDLYRF